MYEILVAVYLTGFTIRLFDTLTYLEREMAGRLSILDKIVLSTFMAIMWPPFAAIYWLALGRGR